MLKPIHKELSEHFKAKIHPNQRLNKDDFTIESTILGKSKTCHVHSGRFGEFNQKVAVKIPSKHTLEELENFINEIAISVNIGRHPNVLNYVGGYFPEKSFSSANTTCKTTTFDDSTCWEDNDKEKIYRPCLISIYMKFDMKTFLTTTVESDDLNIGQCLQYASQMIDGLRTPPHLG